MLRFALVGALLIPVLAHADMYKCVSPDGKTSYSEAPCSDGAVSRLSVGQVASSPSVASSSQEIIDRNLRAAEIMRGASQGASTPPTEQQSFDPSSAVPDVAQPQPAAAPERPARKGVFDPVLNRYLPASGEGLIDPQTGKYFPPTGSGYVDSETGRFIPAP